jgi:hypothetical protein
MLREYSAERLPVRVVVPVASALALAARSASSATWLQFAVATAAAAALFVQFRVWDDLADIPRDAIAHPDRVTVRAATTTPLFASAVLLNLFLSTFLFAAAHQLSMVCLAATVAGFAFYYRARCKRSLGSDHLLLLKYPAFVIVLATAYPPIRSFRLLLAAGAAFLAACVYEGLHDRTSPVAAYPSLLAAEAVLLAAVLVLLSTGVLS